MYSCTISRPIAAIHLLDDASFDETRKGLGKNIGKAYEPEIDDYSSIAQTSSNDIDQFYRNKAVVDIDTGLGFWCAFSPKDEAHTAESYSEGSDWEAHIFLCPNRIAKLARNLCTELFDVNKRNIEKAVFQAVTLHEVGHHYMLANQPISGVRRLTQVELDGIADSRISEGLANTFAYLMGDEDTRRAICQIATKQSLSYRLFLFLKHADISSLLNCFSKPGGYVGAPAALTHVFGGKHNLNGFSMFVKGRYNGVAFDWSGKGGSIIAKEGIWTLTTMLDGCFIAPKIDLLIGRFPPGSLIVANEISKAPDYGSLPSNILVLPKNEVNLEDIISNHIGHDDNDELIWRILVDLRINEQWLGKFRPREKEMENDIERMRGMLRNGQELQ